MDQELLHNIDKRLAVLEALNRSHVKETAVELHEVAKCLEKIEKDLQNMRVKIAGISGSVSVIILAVAKWLNVF